MARRTQSIADQIRRAVAAQGLSKYRLAKNTGINESTVGRFLNGKGSLSLASAETVMRALGFQVIAPKSRR